MAWQTFLFTVMPTSQKGLEIHVGKREKGNLDTKLDYSKKKRVQRPPMQPKKRPFLTGSHFSDKFSTKV